jgi:hypothetical protein
MIGNPASLSLKPLFAMRDSEPLRCSEKPLVPRPNYGARIEQHRSEQVSIDEAKPLSVNSLSIDEIPNLGMGRRRHRWKVLKQGKNHLAVAKGAEGEFADHERMLHNIRAAQGLDHCRIGPVQVVDPHRGIDEDHRSGDVALPRGGRGPRVASSEQCEPPCALPLDESFKALSHECRPLGRPTQFRCSPN